MKMLDFFFKFCELNFGGFALWNKGNDKWQTGCASKGNFISHIICFLRRDITGMCNLWISWNANDCSPRCMPVTISHVCSVLCMQIYRYTTVTCCSCQEEGLEDFLIDNLSYFVRILVFPWTVMLVEGEILRSEEALFRFVHVCLCFLRGSSFKGVYLLLYVNLTQTLKSPERRELQLRKCFSKIRQHTGL